MNVNFKASKLMPERRLDKGREWGELDNRHDGGRMQEIAKLGKDSI